MVTYKNLQDILQLSVTWERKLNDLYDVAQLGLKNEESRKLVAFLKERQDANIDVIEGIDVEKFGPSEFVHFAEDYREEDLIPNQEFHHNSTPEEIVDLILRYEEKLENFYGMIAEHAGSTSQQDLFDSLKRLKEGQTDRIRNFVLKN